ncbi:MAG TPA: NADH-quinone oxidoreductase subunit C [Melioribacteraceae bacterium]|nr:NADH-quinone oxidoreductase subunit C [Melioribacteraceae bacterium]
MKSPDEIFNLLKQEFSDSVLSLDKETPVDPVITVDPFKIQIVGKFLRENPELSFDSLMCLSGVDDANGTKVKDAEGTEILEGGTMSVYYHLHSVLHKHKITLKTVTQRNNPEIESVENVWKSANWHEREAFDLLGIKFLNHPDLRRILMPYDWDQFTEEISRHPLRKDYKNPEFYQGMKVPY